VIRSLGDVAHAQMEQAGELDKSGWEVRPPGPLLRIVVGIQDLLPLLRAERGEKLVCRADDLSSFGLRQKRAGNRNGRERDGTETCCKIEEGSHLVPVK
jgi:hypothetical protein